MLISLGCLLVSRWLDLGMLIFGTALRTKTNFILILISGKNLKIDFLQRMNLLITRGPIL